MFMNCYCRFTCENSNGFSLLEYEFLMYHFKYFYQQILCVTMHAYIIPSAQLVSICLYCICLFVCLPVSPLYLQQCVPGNEPTEGDWYQTNVC